MSSWDLAYMAADLIFNMSLTLETLSMKDKGSHKDLQCLRSRLCLRKVQRDFLPSHLLPSAESENVCVPLIVRSTNTEIIARQEASVGFSACVCQPKGTQGVKLQS